MLIIEDYEIHKLTLPLGRIIGDNNCSYDEINVLAIALKTNHGHTGWGYAESVWQGTFKNAAWYIRQLPTVNLLEIEFNGYWWDKLRNRNPSDLEIERRTCISGYHEIDAAVRLALWDLMAQENNVPLYKLLNPSSQKKEALAYGSILDFPLSDEETLGITKEFINKGFKIIKVKIGADDVERDIDRLKLIQSCVGNEVHLTADGNEAWDWQTALQIIEAYEKNGIHLQYLEDPLNNKDVAGFRELTRRSPIPIIGHDYINQFDDLRNLVDAGGLHGIRTGKDIDYSIRCIDLGKEYNIPVYLGNSLFEVNAHLALAFEQVDRTEYSHLKTNELVTTPIQFRNGFIQAPNEYGHGLSPDRNKLSIFSSEITIQNPVQ